MNPILQAALGSILRWALALLAGYLVKAGIWTGSAAETYVAAATLALLALGWSLWQKYHSRIRFLTALAMPLGATENDVKYQVATGATPALNTGADAVPKVLMLLLMLGGMSLTGCSTVQNANGTVTRQFDANKTVSVLHAIIPPAVRFATTTAPQYRVLIVDAQVAACTLVGSSNVTPANIKVVFDQTGINSIKTPEIEGVTATVYGIYSAFYDDLVTAHLPQNEIMTDMTIVLQGLCDALTQGLALSSPIPTP